MDAYCCDGVGFRRVVFEVEADGVKNALKLKLARGRISLVVYHNFFKAVEPISNVCEIIEFI